MAIVYEHLRNDTNEVFYVGIGEEEKRAFSKKNRNKYWKNIINKVGYSVNIIHKDIDWEDACKIEKLLIEKYGRKDLGKGNLVNMTDGGEGVFGLIMSEETRRKMSEAQKGNKSINFGKTLSEETRRKMSLFQRTKEGVKGYYFNKSRKKYQAQIVVGGKRIRLGHFDTPEEAAEAYQKARLLYFV